MAVKEHKLSLDTELQEVLPAFSKQQVYRRGTVEDPVCAPPKKPIRIRHLMCHQSGIGYDYPNVTVVEKIYQRSGIDFQNFDISLGELTERIANCPLQAEPGEHYVYGYGVDVLAHVLETVYQQEIGRAHV